MFNAYKLKEHKESRVQTSKSLQNTEEKLKLQMYRNNLASRYKDRVHTFIKRMVYQPMQNSSDPYLAQHSKSGRQFKIGVNIITEQERIAKNLKEGKFTTQPTQGAVPFRSRDKSKEIGPDFLPTTYNKNTIPEIVGKLSPGKTYKIKPLYNSVDISFKKNEFKELEETLSTRKDFNKSSLQSKLCTHSRLFDKTLTHKTGELPNFDQEMIGGTDIRRDRPKTHFKATTSVYLRHKSCLVDKEFDQYYQVPNPFTKQRKKQSENTPFSTIDSTKTHTKLNNLKKIIRESEIRKRHIDNILKDKKEAKVKLYNLESERVASKLANVVLNICNEKREKHVNNDIMLLKGGGKLAWQRGENDSRISEVTKSFEDKLTRIVANNMAQKMKKRSEMRRYKNNRSTVGIGEGRESYGDKLDSMKEYGVCRMIEREDLDLPREENRSNISNRSKERMEGVMKEEIKKALLMKGDIGGITNRSDIHIPSDISPNQTTPPLQSHILHTFRPPINPHSRKTPPSQLISKSATQSKERNIRCKSVMDNPLTGLPQITSTQHQIYTSNPNNHHLNICDEGGLVYDFKEIIHRVRTWRNQNNLKAFTLANTDHTKKKRKKPMKLYVKGEEPTTPDSLLSLTLDT